MRRSRQPRSVESEKRTLAGPGSFAQAPEASLPSPAPPPSRLPRDQTRRQASLCFTKAVEAGLPEPHGPPLDLICKYANAID